MRRIEPFEKARCVETIFTGSAGFRGQCPVGQGYDTAKESAITDCGQ